MADTTFQNGTVIQPGWLNAINDFFYTLFQGAITALQARVALGLTDGSADLFLHSLTSTIPYVLPPASITVNQLAPDVIQTFSGATSSVRGLRSVNNGGTSTTQVDLDADQLVLYNPSDGTVFLDNNPSSCTVDITTAGPTLNGRDQAGAFSNDSWVYFYRIYGSGHTSGGIASATPPESGGPTLPTNYTNWAYCTAIYKRSAGTLKLVKTIGSQAYYNDATFPAGSGSGNVLASGSATSITPVDISGFIPPHAVRFTIFSAAAIDSTSGGSASLVTQFFGAGSLGISSNTFSASGLANSTQLIVTFGENTIPNTNQTFEYQNIVNAGANPLVNSYLTSYILPNGDA